MSKFSQKHYEAIADVIAEVQLSSDCDRGGAVEMGILMVMDELSSVFEDDNPRFNADIFVSRCEGVK